MTPTGKGGKVQKMRAVSMPDELWAEAEEVAVSLGMSRAELVRRGLVREIAYGKARAMRQAMKRAQGNGS